MSGPTHLTLHISLDEELSACQGEQWGPRSGAEHGVECQKLGEAASSAWSAVTRGTEQQCEWHQIISFRGVYKLINSLTLHWLPQSQIAISFSISSGGAGREETNSVILPLALPRMASETPLILTSALPSNWLEGQHWDTSPHPHIIPGSEEWRLSAIGIFCSNTKSCGRQQAHHKYFWNIYLSKQLFDNFMLQKKNCNSINHTPFVSRCFTLFSAQKSHKTLKSDIQSLFLKRILTNRGRSGHELGTNKWARWLVGCVVFTDHITSQTAHHMLTHI